MKLPVTIESQTDCCIATGGENVVGGAGVVGCTTVEKWYTGEPQRLLFPILDVGRRVVAGVWRDWVRATGANQFWNEWAHGDGAR